MQNGPFMALALAGLGALCLWRGLRGLLSGTVAGADSAEVEEREEPLHHILACLMWIGGAIAFAVWAWMVWRG